MALKNFYNSKNVFVTGQTGFKGAWLSLWLTTLGTKVSGFALRSEKTSLYSLIKLNKKISSYYGDIKNIEKLKEVLKKTQPEIIFHLAAQPLVIDSYQDPVNTFTTNTLGTINLLEAARGIKSIKSIVIITTDKCYQNKEWDWPYRESDRLGGHDPYSASKAMAELATHSYKKSFFENENIGIATARAGNVIGGGDFGKHRLIPDIIRSIENKESLTLRSPDSIRPWQHVLDCLHGYLLLGKNLYQNPQKFSTSFNFGPKKTHTVNKITKRLTSEIGFENNINIEKRNYHEARILKLDTSKAEAMLNWKSFLSINATIKLTSLWYKSYLQKGDLEKESLKQIKVFNKLIHDN